MNLARQFAFYLLRWQMSTPILWLVVSQLGAGLGATIAANLIGGAIFFWVDRVIFGGRMDIEWELLANGACTDCGYTGLVRRLVFAPGRSRQRYDRRSDPNPQYRCPTCSGEKLRHLRRQGSISSGV